MANDLNSHVFEARATWFLRISCVLLLVTATAKVATLFHDIPYLHTRDVFLDFLTKEQLLLLAACFEVAIVAVVLFWLDDIRIRIYILAWCSTVFLLYRIFTFLIGGFHIVLCPCLGNITSWLHIDPKYADRGMALVLLFLLLGSYSLLFVSKFSQTHRDRYN